MADNLDLLGQTVPVKDYRCARAEGVYHSVTEPKLWLYVNLTDACPGRCPFCVNPSHGKASQNPFDIVQYQHCLEQIAPHVSGVSLTGGEPMLHPELVEQVIRQTNEVFHGAVQIDLVTNGTNLHLLPQMNAIRYLAALHISRHGVDDEKNRQLMGWNAPSAAELQKMMAQLHDPGAVTFNCVLQQGGVENREDAVAFLEFVGQLSVENTAFIGMFQANDYCRTHYISPGSLDFSGDNRFRIWNYFHDHAFCQCSSGDFKSENGYVRFYYRWPGTETAHYVRQLVYTADNHLLAGFGGRQLIF